MKELIQTVKNFTHQEWLNVIFLAVLAFGYNNYSKRIETLENDVKIAREGRAKLFELYHNCVTQKPK
jgi:hypothetical protein